MKSYGTSSSLTICSLFKYLILSNPSNVILEQSKDTQTQIQTGAVTAGYRHGALSCIEWLHCRWYVIPPNYLSAQLSSKRKRYWAVQTTIKYKRSEFIRSTETWSHTLSKRYRNAQPMECLTGAQKAKPTKLQHYSITLYRMWSVGVSVAMYHYQLAVIPCSARIAIACRCCRCSPKISSSVTMSPLLRISLDMPSLSGLSKMSFPSGQQRTAVSFVSSNARSAD